MSVRRILLGALLATAMGVAAPAASASDAAHASQTGHATPVAAGSDFRDQVIYLVMVDRFANGDRTNDHGANPKDPHAYHGGDLAGLRAKLPYLQALGVTTLWLTPVNDNQDGPYLDKYWGYHGYWIQDFGRVDEHFGTDADLQALVADAHARGLKILLDVVVNHCGYDAPMAHAADKATWFHHNGNITDWNDPYQCENFDLVGLPDFNTENKEVLAFMEREWGQWITRDHVDGFRLDTVRHVPIPFWHDFLGAMHAKAGHPFFTVGEVSYHDPASIVPYLQRSGLDAAFDFPMFETLGKVFAKDGSMRLLADRLAQDALYPDPSRLAPFLDSHDEVRFMSQAGGNEARLRLALTCLLTLRGIPCLTYGTEVGMLGQGDPDNRHDMTFGTNPALTSFTRRLVLLRRAHVALRRGSQRTLDADTHVIAYLRDAGAEHLLVCLNNGAKTTTRTFQLPAGRRDAGHWQDLLGGSGAWAAGGKLTVTLPARTGVILAPPGKS